MDARANDAPVACELNLDDDTPDGIFTDRCLGAFGRNRLRHDRIVRLRRARFACNRRGCLDRSRIALRRSGCDYGTGRHEAGRGVRIAERSPGTDLCC